MFRIVVFLVSINICRGFLMPSLDSDPPKCECDCQEKTSFDLYKKYGRYYGKNDFNGAYPNQMGVNPEILRELEEEEESEGLVERIKNYLGASSKLPKTSKWNQNWNRKFDVGQNFDQNLLKYQNSIRNFDHTSPRKWNENLVKNWEHDSIHNPKQNFDQNFYSKNFDQRLVKNSEDLYQNFDENMAKKLGHNVGYQNWDYGSQDDMAQNWNQYVTQAQSLGYVQNPQYGRRAQGVGKRQSKKHGKNQSDLTTTVPTKMI